MKNYLFLLFLFFILHVHAQELERKVLSAAGSNMESGDLSMVWTLGEMTTLTHEGNFFDLFISQGFHQEPSIAVSTVDLDNGLEIEVYPNPAVETIFISSDSKEMLTINIVDILGKTISSQQLNLPIEQSEIDVTQLPAATYFMQVLNEQGNLIRIFKIQKINQ